MCGGLAGLSVGGGERLERKLLNARLCILVGLLEPFLLEDGLMCVFTGSKCVLQCDTGSSTDVALCVLVGEFLDEGCEV